MAWTLFGLVGSQLGDVHDQFITQEDGSQIAVSDYIYQCVLEHQKSLRALHVICAWHLVLHRQPQLCCQGAPMAWSTISALNKFLTSQPEGT